MPAPPDVHLIPPDAAILLLVVRLVLTPRQAEVLHWVAEGKTNSEIGIILACSFFTVKAHLKEIFQRLGVPNRIGAAACAYRAHIAEADAVREHEHQRDSSSHNVHRQNGTHVAEALRLTPPPANRAAS